MLLGEPGAIRRAAEDAGVTLEEIELVNPAEAADSEGLARTYWERRQRRGVTLREARARVRDPLYHGLLLLKTDRADALVVGADMYYPDAVRPALEVIGAAPGRKHVSGIYMMVLPQDVFFFADCTMNIDPDAETLAAIASATAEFVWRLGIEPRVALLSFSNFGSVAHADASKVRSAVALLHEREPSLQVDGEMQADTAVVSSNSDKNLSICEVARRGQRADFSGPGRRQHRVQAAQPPGGARAIGPILVGMARPVHVLQRGADVDEIVNLAVLAAVDAREHRRPARPHT